MKCQALYCNSLNTLWGEGEKNSLGYTTGKSEDKRPLFSLWVFSTIQFLILYLMYAIALIFIGKILHWPLYSERTSRFIFKNLNY